jgi:hypothetical protein
MMRVCLYIYVYTYLCTYINIYIQIYTRDRQDLKARCSGLSYTKEVWRRNVCREEEHTQTHLLHTQYWQDFKVGCGCLPYLKKMWRGNVFLAAMGFRYNVQVHAPHTLCVYVHGYICRHTFLGALGCRCRNVCMQHAYGSFFKQLPYAFKPNIHSFIS